MKEIRRQIHNRSVSWRVFVVIIDGSRDRIFTCRIIFKKIREFVGGLR